MRVSGVIAATVLGLTLCGPMIEAQTNLQDNKASQAQLKSDRKADKEQAKADKEERKALKSHKVKKADKQQDKADKTAGTPR